MEIKEFNKEDPARVGLVVMYYGEAGTGKTFNALSFPGPMLVLDTEHRCELVLKQIANEDKIYIAQVTSIQDIKDALNQFHTKVKDVGRGTGFLANATVVIDSASILLQLAQDHYMSTSGAQKIYPQFAWGKVYAILDALVHTIRELGYNLVFTAQMKDEFIEQQKTNRRIVDIYKRIPYWSDAIIECTYDKKENKRKLTVIKNGYSKNQYFEIETGREALESLLPNNNPIKEEVKIDG
jgi:hypothetical protein